jgi:hypothetical protein
VQSASRRDRADLPTGITVGIGALVVVVAGLIAPATPGAWRLGIVVVAVAVFAAWPMTGLP